MSVARPLHRAKLAIGRRFAPTRRGGSPVPFRCATWGSSSRPPPPRLQSAGEGDHAKRGGGGSRLESEAVALWSRRGVARRPGRIANARKSIGEAAMTGPLDGFRILEFGGIGPAPFAGAPLRAVGAADSAIDAGPRPRAAPDTAPRRH